MADLLPVNSIVSETLGESGDNYDSTTGYYSDAFLITNLSPGYQVTVSVSSSNFDTVLGIYNESTGQYVGINDDGGAGTNSQFTFAPVFGDQDAYYAVVTSSAPNSTGFYNISAAYS